MKRLTQEQIINSRIREIKRKILHTHNKSTRNMYRDHIDYLMSTI